MKYAVKDARGRLISIFDADNLAEAVVDKNDIQPTARPRRSLHRRQGHAKRGPRLQGRRLCHRAGAERRLGTEHTVMAIKQDQPSIDLATALANAGVRLTDDHDVGDLLNLMDQIGEYFGGDLVAAVEAIRTGRLAFEPVDDWYRVRLS
jgi:hypothetical protein